MHWLSKHGNYYITIASDSQRNHIYTGAKNLSMWSRYFLITIQINMNQSYAMLLYPLCQLVGMSHTIYNLCIFYNCMYVIGRKQVFIILRIQTFDHVCIGHFIFISVGFLNIILSAQPCPKKIFTQWRVYTKTHNILKYCVGASLR